MIPMPIEPVKLLLLHRWIATPLLASSPIVAAADRNTLRLTEEEKRISGSCFSSAKSRHGAPWEIIRVAIAHAGWLGSR